METGSTQKAVLYAAKSTEDKRGSIPGQLEECRAFAAELGLPVAAEYSEQDVSAYKDSRGPQLTEALRHVEEIGGTLVAQHSDRLARGDGRTARHLVEIALWARRTGATILWIQDPSTFENLVLAAAMGERNMEDSRRKSAAVTAEMRLPAPGLLLVVPSDERSVLDEFQSTPHAVSLAEMEKAFVLQAADDHGRGDAQVICKWPDLSHRHRGQSRFEALRNQRAGSKAISLCL